MSGGVAKRSVAAAAALAALVACVPASQAVIDGVGGREVGEVGAVGFSAEEQMRRLAFGDDGLQDGPCLPDWLRRAAPSCAAAEESWLDESLGIAGFALDGPAEEVMAAFADELQDHGWVALPGDGVYRAFHREAEALDAEPTWLGATCVQIGKKVSVVAYFR